MENIPCNLCGGSKQKLLFQQQDFLFKTSDEKFNIVQCLNCGLAFVNPRPTQNEMPKYYVSSFYKTDLDAQQELNVRHQQLQGKMKKVAHIAPGKLLDIGCMKGEFLHLMKKKGWEVEGTDLSEIPDNLFNLNIHYGVDFLEKDFDKDSFDLVTMWAVLEHVHDPKAFLKKIHSILKPGGRFVFLVTNFDSPYAKWLQMDDFPRHLTLFSRPTITRYLSMTGYKLNQFYGDNDIFFTSGQGLTLFFIRHFLLRIPINQLAWEYKKDANRFILGKNTSAPSLGRRIIYRIDQIVCRFIIDPFLAKVGKGHTITVEAEKVTP